MTKNYGYVEKPIEQEHYILGSNTLLPKEVLQEDGNWLPFIPTGEEQSKSIDTYNCSAFGSTNIIETYLFRKYGDTRNWSDRALGIVAGTFPPGNDPHIVCEAIRKNGLIEEYILPFTDDIYSPDDYFSPKPVPEKLSETAKKFLQEYDYGHEWVFSPFSTAEGRIEAIKEALTYSPLGVAVYAWEKQGDLYVRRGYDNHWTEMVGYKEGEYWVIYDSYPDDGVFVKHLDWNFDFNRVKRIHISKKENPVTEVKSDYIIKLCEFLKKVLTSLSNGKVSHQSPI